MTGTRIAAIELLCPQPIATAKFYAETFGCRRAGSANEVLLGEQRLAFVRATAATSPGAPSQSTAFQHCAIVVSDMRKAMACLMAASGWTAISRNGPERLPEASGGATAFKFRDPDGHPLEFLQFPPDRIPTDWRRGEAGPFLGIDHSAITVADTERAIAFWSGRGFEVTDRHVNRGPEQARMDGLDMPEAIVEVTTLLPAGGSPPHLELLRYRMPDPLPGNVPDGSPLATSLLLQDAPGSGGPAADPDGHRFRLLPR